MSQRDPGKKLRTKNSRKEDGQVLEEVGGRGRNPETTEQTMEQTMGGGEGRCGWEERGGATSPGGQRLCVHLPQGPFCRAPCRWDQLGLLGQTLPIEPEATESLAQKKDIRFFLVATRGSSRGCELHRTGSFGGTCVLSGHACTPRTRVGRGGDRLSSPSGVLDRGGDPAMPSRAPASPALRGE